MKRNIPLLITALGGFILIIAYFIPATQGWGEVAANWFDVLASIAFILGGGNLIKIHLKKISDKSVGWAYSAITISAFVITLFVGLGKVGVSPNPQYPDFSLSGHYREIGSPFWWLYEYAFKPLTATMFAMLAFYISSAAFRAFRAKNIEAILSEAHLSRDAIVRLNAYVVDRQHMAGYMRARDRFTDSLDCKPASTLMIVSGFTRPEFLVEVEAIAIERN